tara:strand:+ start:335 stop:1051 length:717 start_codon:yes stop_codon:yes gene_type:complete
MTSLVVSAAPFENNEENNNSINSKKRYNKTVKRNSGVSRNKVSNLLDKIKKMNEASDRDNNEENVDDLADFIPPPAPISAGVEKTKREEPGINVKSAFDESVHNQPVQYSELSAVDNSDENDDVSYFNKNKMENSIYTDNNEPNTFSQLNGQSPYGTPYMMAQGSPIIEGYNVANPDFKKNRNSGDLEEKINYIINILEDQQDHKTDTIVEELILYCFLGVFIIFIVDSFAKASKYTR